MSITCDQVGPSMVNELRTLPGVDGPRLVSRGRVDTIKVAVRAGHRALSAPEPSAVFKEEAVKQWTRTWPIGVAEINRARRHRSAAGGELELAGSDDAADHAEIAELTAEAARLQAPLDGTTPATRIGADRPGE